MKCIFLPQISREHFTLTPSSILVGSFPPLDSQAPLKLGKGMVPHSSGYNIIHMQ